MSIEKSVHNVRLMDLSKGTLARPGTPKTAKYAASQNSQSRLTRALQPDFSKMVAGEGLDIHIERNESCLRYIRPRRFDIRLCFFCML